MFIEYVKGISTSKTEDICQYIWDISEQFALQGAECGKIARSDLCRGTPRKERIYSPGSTHRIGVGSFSKLLLLFDATPDMMSIGIDALRIISISFVFAGFCIVCSTVFQALGRGMLSLIISIVRQLGVFLPLAYILACTLDLHAVWYAFPLADIVSVILAIIGLRRVYKLKIKKL